MPKLPNVPKAPFGSFDTFGSRILAGEVPEADPAEAAEREAIQAEPELPRTGTPERERLDHQHRMMVAGLLRSAAQRPHPSARIPDLQPQEIDHGQ
jgi:hypothetical protein